MVRLCACAYTGSSCFNVANCGCRRLDIHCADLAPLRAPTPRGCQRESPTPRGCQRESVRVVLRALRARHVPRGVLDAQISPVVARVVNYLPDCPSPVPVRQELIVASHALRYAILRVFACFPLYDCMSVLLNPFFLCCVRLRGKKQCWDAAQRCWRRRLSLIVRHQSLFGKSSPSQVTRYGTPVSLLLFRSEPCRI